MCTVVMHLLAAAGCIMTTHAVDTLARLRLSPLTRSRVAQSETWKRWRCTLRARLLRLSPSCSCAASTCRQARGVWLTDAGRGAMQAPQGQAWPAQHLDAMMLRRQGGEAS